MVKIVWDLTNPLSKRKENSQIVVKPIVRAKLREVGKILVVTWEGFIKAPDTTVNYVGPYMDKGVEQPFIALSGRETRRMRQFKTRQRNLIRCFNLGSSHSTCL